MYFSPQMTQMVAGLTNLPLFLGTIMPGWLCRLWNSVQEAFQSTFIDDNRYKIFLTGLQNTLVITLGALVLGVLIGVFVAVCKVYYYQTGPFKFWESFRLFLKSGCRETRFLGQMCLKLMDSLLNLYLTLFRGTPVVVQIMIWAFVILSSANEILVAVIGFGVNSGAYVSEIVRAGIMAVDKGQTEAGRSLGLSAWKTMRLIVLPQAFKNVLPALSNEVIALLKETSIVGYVAVVDITKAASLVRARTFDAFVPLLFVASFYLFMVYLLTCFQSRLEKSLQASDRK